MLVTSIFSFSHNVFTTLNYRQLPFVSTEFYTSQSANSLILEQSKIWSFVTALNSEWQCFGRNSKCFTSKGSYGTAYTWNGAMATPI